MCTNCHVKLTTNGKKKFNHPMLPVDFFISILMRHTKVTIMEHSRLFKTNYVHVLVTNDENSALPLICKVQLTEIVRQW